MALFKKLWKWLKRKCRVRRLKPISDMLEMPDVLTAAQIEEIRFRIIDLLESTRRRGIDKVIKYLDSSGFFIVPSSVNHHHNWRGGLAQHSLDVYYKASQTSQGAVPEDSLIIACLLHDICKSDLLRYDKQGRLCRYTNNPSGHGRRSVQILEKCGLDMYDTERRAIRWHMGGHNAHSYENQEVNRTRRDTLWKLVHYTDREDAKR